MGEIEDKNERTDTERKKQGDTCVTEGAAEGLKGWLNTEEAIRNVEEGLSVERLCRGHAEEVCNAIDSIRENMLRIVELANQVKEAWDGIKDDPDVAAERPHIEPGIGIITMLTTLPFDKMAARMKINRAESLGPFDRNIMDLTELISILRLKEQSERLEQAINKELAPRRKPLYRELKRVLRAIVAAAPSILFGHFKSPNTDPEMCEATYVAVNGIVERAKERLHEIGKLALA